MHNLLYCKKSKSKFIFFVFHILKAFKYFNSLKILKFRLMQDKYLIRFCMSTLKGILLCEEKKKPTIKTLF